jgi:polysaccharide biosynthesis protein PslH
MSEELPESKASFKKRKILLLSPYRPFPATFGGAVRTYHIIKQLSRFHEVHLLCYAIGEHKDSKLELDKYCRSVTYIPLFAGDKRWIQLKSIFSNASYQAHFHNRKIFQSSCDELIKLHHIDLIFIEFSQMSIFNFPTNIPKVLDEHNVEWLLLDRMAKQGSYLRRVYNYLEAKKFKREEFNAVQNSTMTIATSDVDATLLKQGTHPEVGVVINGVDCEYFSPKHNSPKEFNSAKIVFVGATHYFPNEDGVMFYLNRIHAGVIKKIPHCSLKVVGGRPSSEMLSKASSSVEITGFVDNVLPYLWEADLFIVPLRLGSGTRFKIVEAMAAGVPVISTRLGAEGLPVIHGENIWLAETPQEWIDGITFLLRSPELCKKLALAGQELVKSFDWNILGLQLANLLDHLPMTV